MRYVSTRGQAAPAGFTDVLLAGPAADGGLYMPEEWPLFSQGEIRAMATKPYSEVALQIIRGFVGDAFAEEDLAADINAAYGTFAHQAIAPLSQLAPNLFLLELFHGPTLSFKDVAMQLLGRLFARALKQRGQRATVIVATSGDTGSAAIAALKGLPGLDLVVMHPKGRTSDVQRRQMTSVSEANVHNIALEGTFDDTQSIVKALFADVDFARATHLAAVNSINFARIAAQSVYYFVAGAALGAGYGRRATFVVPTGNFGDVFAGEAAWRMGLPIERLVVATNSNDIMARALESGVYESGTAQPTLSPSMDIQVASNFERALFEASNRDANWLTEAMRTFAQSRRLGIVPEAREALRARYAAGRADDAQTLDAIKRIYEETGMTIDPHTAVAVHVAQQTVRDPAGPVVVLSTAHPAKFPDAVARATGEVPAMPRRLGDLMQREERYVTLPNDVWQVRKFILDHVGAS
jgi:threonine synthase